MPGDYSRIHRLLKILTLIQGGDGWTAARLARECQTTERTIYRDLKMLDAAGIPYFYDPDRKCYHIRRDFFMPPVELTLEESLALTALAEHIGHREQVPFTKAAGKAIAKVRSQLPASIRAALERIDRAVTIQLAATNPPEAGRDVYTKVQNAIATRKALCCRYESVRASTAASQNHDGAAVAGRQSVGGEFLFEPYALFFATRAWYAIGLHRRHGEVRCMKLTRFSWMRPTDQDYEIPKRFSLEKHLGLAWRMIRGKPRYKVELRFDPGFAETVADTLWHKTQEVEWLDDGAIRFTCTVDGLDEIVWWVLSMGPHCRVLRPPELAGRVRELSEQMLALYRQSGDLPVARPKPSRRRTRRGPT